MPREYPERPIVGVGVVIFNGDSVLLVRRKNPPRENELSLPGGAQKVGETVVEAAVREVFEETGLKIKVHGIVDVVDAISLDKTDKVQYHYTLVEFIATSEEKILPVAGTDAGDPIWVQKYNIDSLCMWPETKRIINLAAEMAELIV
ncbi:MAG: phosphohydrolase [Magnetovibrio sp.]|nr:phosphohydrolase [Magnetovibrio sp.]